MARFARLWGSGSGRSDAAARSADLALLRSSPLFDAGFYAELYPDLAGYEHDLAEHYLRYGGGEGRMPHPLFDGAFYLETYPDIATNDLNPLIHYITTGAAEGRDPSPLFATAWYADRYLCGSRSRADALAHYLDHPLNDASPLFRSAWYAACREEDAEAPLAHYARVGRDAGFLGNGDGLPEPGSPAARLLASGLFDADFYLAAYPDVRADDDHPFSHYMMLGYREGRQPTPLFDVGFYLSQAIDCADGQHNPLLHYLDHGALAGFDPNPLFDTSWYLAEHPSCVATAQNPLAHFLADGGRSAQPSLRFDAPWYLDRHPDVAVTGENPLVHYLVSGMEEGRVTRRVPCEDDPHGDVTRAPIRLVSGRVPSSGRIALVVTHAPEGQLKGYVGHTVNAYQAAGFAVVLIVAADQRRTAIPRSVASACSAVYLRGNAGFDFAAWAHVLRLEDDVLGADLLVLANDSVIGPLDAGGLQRIMAAVDASPADVVGLTENAYFARHLQSFFLALKPRCLSSYEFNAFMGAVVTLPTKDQVIAQYEMTFSSRMRAGEMRTEALFAGDRPVRQGEPGSAADRTILEWEILLDEGFPFIKASLVNGQHRGLGGEAARRVLVARGFDPDLLDPVHRASEPVIWGDLEAIEVPRTPLRVAFLGPSNIANGLGMAARGYVKALHRTSWTVDLHPMRRPFHVHARLTPDWQARSFDGDADVALVHVNGDSWDALLDESQTGIVDRAGRRVGLFVWETSHVPRDWRPTIDRLDAIWVPTEFCAEIFRAVTPVPVAVVPYVVENEDIEPVSAADRSILFAAFGLDASRRHVLYAFDGSSFLARKNPQALIRAFRAAGLGGRWQLVLKTKHVFDLPLEGKRLLDLVGNTGDVVVIDRPMPPLDHAALFALCPVYASSHASEGFGLTIAEAMELGKVVVATDYGGSRDFLDASCGFPVRADEVRLAETIGPYRRGSVWGKVDEQALAEALCRATLAVEDGTAEAIGAAARARVRERLSVGAVAVAMNVAMDDLLREPGP